MNKNIKEFQLKTLNKEMSNFLSSSNTLSKSSKEFISKMISPFAPHLGDEIWRKKLGNKGSVFESGWPEHNPSFIVESTLTIAVQVNGKLRGSLEVDKGADKESIITLSKEIENVRKYIDSGTLIKEIYVPEKIVNFVIKL